MIFPDGKGPEEMELCLLWLGRAILMVLVIVDPSEGGGGGFILFGNVCCWPAGGAC